MEDTAMVLESARRKLADLAPLAQRLNDLSDAFTEELRTMEAELSRLAVGVDVTLNPALILGHDEETRGENRDGEMEVTERWSSNDYLAYGRYGPAWRLLVRTFDDHDSQVEGDYAPSILTREIPLLEASRDLRMAAAERIGDLLGLIERETKQKIAALEKATDKK